MTCCGAPGRAPEAHIHQAGPDPSVFAVWLWASYSTSLSLPCLRCHMGIQPMWEWAWENCGCEHRPATQRILLLKQNKGVW